MKYKQRESLETVFPNKQALVAEGLETGTLVLEWQRFFNAKPNLPFLSRTVRRLQRKPVISDSEMYTDTEYNHFPFSLPF